MDVLDEPLPTTDAAKSIKAINRDTVHKICSGQVVLSLAIAVKELVENALDAGATLIEVKLREQGLTSIEVSDNGSGVEECNFLGLTAKYHTSKLREFSDLIEVETFGFRGEALSSLCALSEMTIITKHITAAVGTKLELNNRGEIVKKSACARHQGTTVALANLFANLPVRKREFQRNIKKEFIKMCQILQGYGLIAYGCRIIVTNQMAKGGQITVMSTNGTNSMLDNIVTIFGSKQKCDLLEIRQPIEHNETLTQEIIKSLDPSIDVRDEDLDSLGLHRFRFEGFISSCSHGSGRSARDRQFFFINGRPYEPKEIIKLVNDMYHRYNVQQNPFIVLNIILERSEVDINLTPDKRQILVNNETILRLALKKSLLSTFGQVPASFKMQNATINSTFENKNLDRRDDEASDASSTDDDFEKKMCTQKGDSTKYANMLSQWRMTGNTDEPIGVKNIKRKQQPTDDISMRTLKIKKIHEYLSQDIPMAVENYTYKSESDTEDEQNENNDEVVDRNESLSTSYDVVESKSEKNFRIDCNLRVIDSKNQTLKIEKFTPQKTINKSPVSSVPTDDPVRISEADANEQNSSVIVTDNEDQIVSSTPPQNLVTISTSLSEIKELIVHENELKEKSEQNAKLNRLRFKAKIDPTKNKLAEQELKMEISKDDFTKMELIGQFNLGFIVVRLADDLFIIDQHATDEKYNFETLQKTTCLQHQPLVVPQSLELTAVNEMILMDNLKVFEMNGFKFDIDLERPVTKRIKLIAKPFSKNWEFGKDDIDELVFMLQEGSGDASSISTCRPSRVRAMFASRACRSSVMIGTPLSKTNMRRLVDQMGTIEHPWNCPHGRPTIRHLVNLAMLNLNESGSEADGINTEIACMSPN